MKQLNNRNYLSLCDFCDDITNNGKIFPLKIMGKKNSSEFFSASMLASAYSDTPDPDMPGTAFSVDTFFGTIRKKGSAIDSTIGYSSISPTKDGNNHFQGDIIRIDLNDYLANRTMPYHQWAMILSQSCDIHSAAYTILIPVYLESQLSKDVLEELKGSQVKNELVTKANWLENENHKFIGFPSANFYKSGDDIDDERFLVALPFATSIPKGEVLRHTCILRLRYRMLAYFQWRTAIFFLRDVLNSDETRDF